MEHTPRHSPHAGEQSRSARRQEHLLVEQPVLHEHLITSSKALGAISLSVIIGMRFPPDNFQPQFVGGKLFPPCLYLVIDSIAEFVGGKLFPPCLYLVIDSIAEFVGGKSFPLHVCTW